MSQTPRQRIVFIAALQREISAVVKGWRAEESLRARRIHLYSNEEAVIASAGMGGDRASLAIEAALALGPASELVSVGFAGSCNNRFQPGDAINPKIVIDARTGERFFVREPDTTEAQEILVTVPTPAGIVQKRRLGSNYLASGVDMEAATVARMAHARGLPFSAIKTISDGLDFELPDLARFSTANGQFREVAFGLHAAFRPWLWGSVLTLAKGSKLAARRLQIEIEERIQEHRDRRR